MKYNRTLFVITFFLLFQSCGILGGKEQYAGETWNTEELVNGAKWKYLHTEKLYDSKQSISVFDLDLEKKDFLIQIPHVDSGFSKTSILAERAGGFAAINGSFFDTEKGGSVVYFRKEGKTLAKTRSGFAPYRDNAGFAIDRQGNPSIVEKPRNGWESGKELYTLLSSGPLLLKNGKIPDQVEEKFNSNRHPRTAIGITADNHLIAVVVDGRSSEAHGMSIPELASLMKSLGCENAMNLDGGGSSTAWVKDAPYQGVVNFPSDNKNFDHLGEREVANALVFIKE